MINNVINSTYEWTRSSPFKCPGTSPTPMGSQSTWGSHHRRHGWSHCVLDRGLWMPNFQTRTKYAAYAELRKRFKGAVGSVQKKEMFYESLFSSLSIWYEASGPITNTRQSTKNLPATSSWEWESPASAPEGSGGRWRRSDRDRHWLDRFLPMGCINDGVHRGHPGPVVETGSRILVDPENQTPAAQSHRVPQWTLIA